MRKTGREHRPISTLPNRFKLLVDVLEDRGGSVEITGEALDPGWSRRPRQRTSTLAVQGLRFERK